MVKRGFKVKLKRKILLYYLCPISRYNFVRDNIKYMGWASCFNNIPEKITA